MPTMTRTDPRSIGAGPIIRLKAAGPVSSDDRLAFALAGLAVIGALVVGELLTIGAAAPTCVPPTGFDELVAVDRSGGLLLAVAGGALVAGAGAAVLVETVDRRFQDLRRNPGAAAVFPGEADPAVVSLVEEPFETVEETHRNLSELEQLFRERGDHRAVFLTVYARVTGEVATSIERGEFENPGWVADYLVTFANFYRRAVYDFETGRVDALPTAWRYAFRAAAREETFVLQHAALGINAHVTFDLAFALTAVGIDGDRRTKYADHQRINLVLWELVDETLHRLAVRYAPGIATIEKTVGPVVKLGWFGALLVGRETAWWIALILTELDGTSLSRAATGLVATASNVVALTVIWPTAHPVTAAVVRSAIRLLGVRSL